MTINGSSIGISIRTATGTLMTINQSLFASFFVDPGASTTLLLAAEGAGASSRVTVADFTGDGRDDILVHGFDGKVHLFVSNGTSFIDPPSDTAHTPFVGGAGDVSWESSFLGSDTTFRNWVNNAYYVKPMPCDLNGDGRTDYVCVTYGRSLTYNPSTGVVTGFSVIRRLTGVLCIPDTSPAGFTFSPPFQIGQPPTGVPFQTSADGSIALDDVNSGVIAGDFNGDGLTDFLMLVPPRANVDNLYSTQFGSHRWALFINRGVSSFGTPVFTQCNGPIPNTVTLPGTGETVNSYFTPFKSSSGHPGLLMGAVNYLNSSNNPSGFAAYTGFESAAGSAGHFVMDINHDGLADFVWYVATKPDETPATGAGWYAMISTGKFDGSSPGFITVPIKLDYLSGAGAAAPYDGSTSFTIPSINNGMDYNGDGQPDYFIQPTANGQPSGAGNVYLSTAPFGDVVASLTDGLGRVTTVAYKGAKDDSVYTAGAAVSYPIRELRASTPVVSDVFQDSGGTTPAQFSYQYSGNRLDLSGRGSLGFHSFVTLDRQTNLFKYQFLAQSFPMTGLTAREETYRWLGGNIFNIISAHDNIVVFDSLSIASGATRWPVIYQAVESRWEDGVGQITLGTSSNLSSNPRKHFPPG